MGRQWSVCVDLVLLRWSLRRAYFQFRDWCAASLRSRLTSLRGRPVHVQRRRPGRRHHWQERFVSDAGHFISCFFFKQSGKMELQYGPEALNREEIAVFKMSLARDGGCMRSLVRNLIRLHSTRVGEEYGGHSTRMLCPTHSHTGGRVPSPRK